jgi:adhesin/invasin
VATFTIDTLPPPAPVIVEGPTNPSTDTSPEFEVTDAGYPNVTFSCYLDSSPVMNCTGDTDHDSDPSVQGEWQFENLTPGPHCFYVYATDEAANVGPTTTSCWTITLVPSAIAVSSGSNQTTPVHTAFAAPLAAKVTDAHGNPVAGVPVTFSAPTSGPSGTFASCSGGNPTSTKCTVTTDATGTATSSVFTAATVAGGPYTVTASVSGVSTAAGFSLTNTAGAATTIAVVSGSGQSATVHAAFASPLVAKATDTYGNPVSGVTVTFTAPTSGPSGTFAGSVNTAVTNASGVATSATFTANTTAGTYTVTAAATGTNTASFTETNTAGAATKLAFTSQPTSGQNITAGAATAFKVAVEDTYGNVETADASTQVTLAMTANPGGSTLSCTNAGGTGPVTVSGGVAGFTCSLNKAGTGYALAATSNPAHGTTATNAFNIVAGAASQLVFSTQPPASTPASSTFGTAVSIEDLYGNVVTGDTHTVTVSLSANPCAGTLAGTTSKAAVAGVASFTNLQITTACAGYTLKAADVADGPMTATSNGFAITPASPSKLVFTTQPPASTPATSTFTVAVTIEDTYGNTETGDSHTVALSLSTNPCSGTLGGATAQAAVAGVAIFSNLQITTACTGYTLNAADGADGPLVATSNPFTITGSAAAAIAMSSGSPQFTTVSTAFGSPLVAKVTDSQGNPVSGVAVTFTAPASGASGAFVSCSGGNPTAYSCVVTTNAGGLATASTFTANATSGAYSVTATVTGVGTPATFSLINSANFTISGNVPALYPGTSQKVNLVFTNPNPSPITVATGAVTTTISTTQAGCSASANFAVTQGLTASVTVPASSTKSLSDLGIAQANWPVVAMVETHTNQDACEGAPLTFTYSGSATG